MTEMNAVNTQSIADYLAQLLKDRKQITAFPNMFMHVERLIDEGNYYNITMIFYFTITLILFYNRSLISWLHSHHSIVPNRLNSRLKQIIVIS